MKISVVQADITTVDVDAIVNAANRAMRGGGGVDGAVHKAAGPALLAECKQRFPHGLETGHAGWTHGFDLPARFVIHVVGPNRHAGQTDPDLLASCYREALHVADGITAATLAFPLVSAGIYGWDPEEAARIAVGTLRATPTDVVDVTMVAFGDRAERVLAAAVAARPA